MDKKIQEKPTNDMTLLSKKDLMNFLQTYQSRCKCMSKNIQRNMLLYSLLNETRSAYIMAADVSHNEGHSKPLKHASHLSRGKLRCIAAAVCHDRLFRRD